MTETHEKNDQGAGEKKSRQLQLDHFKLILRLVKCMEFIENACFCKKSGAFVYFILFLTHFYISYIYVFVFYLKKNNFLKVFKSVSDNHKQKAKASVESYTGFSCT